MMNLATKRLKLLAVWGIALLASMAAWAQIATYKVTVEAKQKVVIDGKLQEECWQGQPMISQFQQYRHDPEAVTPATTVWMAKEKDALLIAVECMEPEMDQLHLNAKHHDDKTWMDDSVELFFNPAGDRQSHVQIVINADGIIMDGISDYLGAPLDMSWDSGMEAKTRKQKDRWTLEARLPYASLPLGKPDVDWTFHVARGRRTGQKTQLLTSLQSSISKFAEVSAFDFLQGVSPEGMRLSLTEYDYGDCLIGHNELKMNLRNWDQQPARVTVRSGLEGGAMAEKTVAVPPQSETTVVSDWHLESADAGRDFIVEVLVDGRLLRQLRRPLSAVPPVLGQLQRNVFWLSDGEATIVRFPVQIAELSRRHLSVSWWLVDEAGECVVSGLTQARQSEAVLRLFWPFAGDGHYQLVRRLEQGGKVIAEARDLIVLIRGPF